jgi:hypothetical protein
VINEMADEATAAEEATMAAVAEEATIEVAAKEVAMTKSSDAGGDEPGAAGWTPRRTRKRWARGLLPQWGRVDPAPLASAFTAPGGMIYTLYIFFLFPAILCMGLLTLASAIQGDKPERDAIVPGLPSAWLYRGWWPLGFDSRCGP